MTKHLLMVYRKPGTLLQARSSLAKAQYEMGSQFLLGPPAGQTSRIWTAGCLHSPCAEQTQVIQNRDVPRACLPIKMVGRESEPLYRSPHRAGAAASSVFTDTFESPILQRCHPLATPIFSSCWKRSTKHPTPALATGG